MLSNNSNKIRHVKGIKNLQAPQTRPSLLQKQGGGTNAKGTPKKSFAQFAGKPRPQLPGGKGDEAAGVKKERPAVNVKPRPSEVGGINKRPAPKHPNAKTFTDGQGRVRPLRKADHLHNAIGALKKKKG